MSIFVLLSDALQPGCELLVEDRRLFKLWRMATAFKQMEMIRKWASSRSPCPLCVIPEPIVARPKGSPSSLKPMRRRLDHFQNNSIWVPEITRVPALVDASGDGIRWGKELNTVRH